MRAYELFESEQLTPEDALKGFKHRDAAKYGKKMLDVLGDPESVGTGMLYWKKFDGMLEPTLIDESIPHSFPKAHKDYVYSGMTIEVPEQFYSLFAHVTGSILIDGLKKRVTARCGALIANAITLQFVKDVVAGDAPQSPNEAKEEYSKRIKAWKGPSWYKNKIKD